MMPPHDKSADGTTSPSSPYSMYCSPIESPINATSSPASSPVNQDTTKSSTEPFPSKLPFDPPSNSTDAGAGMMFCSPIASPTSGQAINSQASSPSNGNTPKSSEKPLPRNLQFTPPPNSSDAGAGMMFCAPIQGSAMAPPPQVMSLPASSKINQKTPKSVAESLPPSSTNGEAGMVFCAPTQGSAMAPPPPLPMFTSKTRKEKKPKTISPPPPPKEAPTSTAAAQSAYHPDYMFCGSCTTCLPEDEKKFATESENLDDYLGHKSMDDDSEDEKSATHQTRLRITEFPANSSAFLMVHGLMLQSLLQPLTGVESVVIETEGICVHHTLETSQAQLVAALKRGGYTSHVLEESPKTEVSNTQSSDDYSSSPTIVRSQFHVGGICCAMEIPAIRKIIKPMFGVEKIQINITTKMVYVQHDARSVSAQAIADSLTKDGFPSEVRVDGSTQIMQQPSQRSSHAKTRLQVQTHAPKEEELNLIRQKLEQVPGIEKVEIDVQDILLEHDIDLIEAKSIPPLIQGWELVVVDTAQDAPVPDSSIEKSDFVESTLVIDQLQHRNVETLQLIFRQNYIKAQVRAFFANVPSRTIKVEHNPDLLPIYDIPKLLEPYGLNAHVAVDGKEAGLYLPVVEEYGASEGMMEEQRDPTLALKWHVILSGLFWVLSMLSAFGGGMVYFEYFGLLSVFFGLPPVAQKAWRTFRRRQFDSNCMMVTAALGALLLQEYDEAASVAFLFSVSEFLEARSTSKARKALEAIVQLRPDHASVIHPTTKEITIVPVSKIPVGSLVSVRTGDKIAADGVVVEGVSTVDESSLTGESKPIMKRKDDVVSGGTINVGTTQLVVKTTSTVEDSVVSRLIKVVEDAQSCRSLTEKMIDKFAKSYTPFVVCLAGLMCTIPWLWGAETGRYWTLNGLIVIVIACPCSLTISTPVTYAAGLAATAQRGIIVKGGAHLEALGAVNNVCMDKTGTITHGQFRVDNLKEVGTARTRKEMLELLALMEAPSSHPLSETLVRAAQKEGVSIPRDAEVVLHTVLKGEGVTAQVNGKQVYVGNKRLFERIQMYSDMPSADQIVSSQWADKGATVGFVGMEGEGIIGAFSMIDTIRDEARDTIQSLQTSNINVYMLTGDGDGAAQAVAKQVGMLPSSVQSQLLPEDKLHFVGSLIRPEVSGCGPCKERSKVLFVGDGINDTPALAVADVGVSMGDGAAALAMEVSDVTLMDSSLSKLLYVIQMGRRVVNTIQENIAFSLFSKLLVVGLTFGGKMTLFGAIASDVGVMLMVTLNGMKLLPVSSDLERKSKIRIRSPKFSSYDKIDSQGEADVELCDVSLSNVEPAKIDSNLAAIV